MTTECTHHWHLKAWGIAEQQELCVLCLAVAWNPRVPGSQPHLRARREDECAALRLARRGVVCPALALVSVRENTEGPAVSPGLG